MKPGPHVDLALPHADDLVVEELQLVAPVVLTNLNATKLDHFKRTKQHAQANQAWASR